MKIVEKKSTSGLYAWSHPCDTSLSHEVMGEQHFTSVIEGFVVSRSTWRTLRMECIHGARRWGQLSTLDGLAPHSGQKLEEQDY